VPDRTGSMDDNSRYSPEVHEILGRKPSWIIRWGIVVITLLFLLGLVASRFIPFAENLSFPFVLKRGIFGAGSSGLSGIVRIQGGDKTYVKPGQSVIVTVVSDGSFRTIRLEGSVNAIMPDSTGNAVSAEIVIRGSQLARIPLSASELPATARITVGRSDLLEQILRPIRSMFSSSSKTL
jgi:hypothetical protein